eukprot:4645452-Amphidinium_carterae.1
MNCFQISQNDSIKFSGNYFELTLQHKIAARSGLGVSCCNVIIFVWTVSGRSWLFASSNPSNTKQNADIPSSTLEAFPSSTLEAFPSSTLEAAGGNPLAEWNWDCAPVHLAALLREQIRDSFPFCHLCYIKRETTSINQPLDVGYFRSIKAELEKTRCHGMARMVLAGSDLDPNYKLICHT